MTDWDAGQKDPAKDNNVEEKEMMSFLNAAIEERKSLLSFEHQRSSDCRGKLKAYLASYAKHLPRVRDGEIHAQSWRGRLCLRRWFRREPYLPWISSGLTDRRGTVQLAGEQGVEVFYNYFITPWLRLIGDIQWIDIGRDNLDEAVLAAVRRQTRF